MTRRQLGYLRWVILIVLIGDGLFAAAAVVAFSDQKLGGLFLNLGTELVGAAITYGLFELVIGLTKESVEKEEELENLKAELITQMGSDEREVAVPAGKELRRRGWLTDGSLQGVDLENANLQKAYLNDANLERANLWKANFEEAYLMNTNLERATLVAANLRGTYLDGANLQGTYVTRADLEGAHLTNVRLNRGTKITDPQLAQAATLEGAYCSLEREETEDG